MQAVFSTIFYFAPIALYQGWLMVGYATIYTMAPVFSLVLDKDVSESGSIVPWVVQRVDEGMSLYLFVPVSTADIGLPGSRIVIQDFLPMVDD